MTGNKNIIPSLDSILLLLIIIFRLIKILVESMQFNKKSSSIIITKFQYVCEFVLTSLIT